MTERLCACGCGASLEGLRSTARYATNACRSRHWRNRTGYRIPTASEQRRPSQNGSSKPSGLQVSYRKAVAEVARMLERSFIEKPHNAQRYAEQTIKAALSDRQLQALVERERVA